MSETWLRAPALPSFIGYSFLPKHRQAPQRGGGLAFLVRSDLSFAPCPLVMHQGGHLEVDAVTLYLRDGRPIDILNLYNPNEPVTSAEFTHYFSQLSRNKLILGDFNAHHPLWDPHHPSNICGGHLHTSLFRDLSLHLLTPPALPTYFSVHHASFSTLDLAFISAQFSPVSQVFTGPDLGSDHYPVVVNIAVAPCLSTAKARRRWIFDDTRWDEFCRLLPEREEGVVSDVAASAGRFVAQVLAASSSVFTLTKGTVALKYSKPWWNEDCARAVRAKRDAKATLVRCPSPVHLLSFKRCDALVRRTTREAKRSCWRKFCSTLTVSTPSALVWRRLRRLRHPFKVTNHPFVLPNSIVTSSLDKAEALASHYRRVLNSRPDRSNATHMLLPLSLALLSEEQVHFNQSFLPSELRSAVATLSDSSPGEDLIHNQHLRHLPGAYYSWLLDIFNSSYSSGVVPASWKVATILPLPKPGKVLSAPASYRPISLLSYVGKLMEKLINVRLHHFLETSGALRQTQGGFRRRYSAAFQFARVERVIRSALSSRSCAVVVFCDLSSAFDVVWHTALLYKLSRAGIRGVMLRWLRSYLSDRSFKVFFEGEFSAVRSVGSGVPQGSILAPTLFNVMMSDLPVVNGVGSAEYADDVCFFCEHSDVHVATSRIQLMLDSFYRWTKKWGMSLNLLKTKAMFFSRRRIDPPSLVVDNTNLEYVREYCYLGFHLDAPLLRWTSHIDNLKSRCRSGVSLLHAIAHNHWGSDRTMLLRIYKSLIRSKLDYAAPFYQSAAPSQKKKLDVLQNECLRLALGARKTTPILTLEMESNVPPLEFRRQYLVVACFARLCSMPSSSLVVSNLVLPPDPTPEGGPLTNLFFLSQTARSILARFSITHPRPVIHNLVSPFPPWSDINVVLCTNFVSVNVSGLSSSSAVQVFADMLSTTYRGFVAAFTDGSRVAAPVLSSSAALVVPSRGVSLNWKLESHMEVIQCELFAIGEALRWATNNLYVNDNFVIFTDSLSSVFMIADLRPRRYIREIYSIHSLLLQLSGSHTIRIQFVPGHRGISGNEAADAQARAAHDLRFKILLPPSPEHILRSLRDSLRDGWATDWRQSVVRTGTGRFLGAIKTSPGFWPWSHLDSRPVEVALARLRMGHAGVNAHMARFGMRDSDLCDCGAVETIAHYLLTCPVFRQERSTLVASLTSLGVQFTLRNILGGGDFPSAVQFQIVNSMSSYLQSSHKLFLL